jgi:hypothetical protein
MIINTVLVQDTKLVTLTVSSPGNYTATVLDRNNCTNATTVPFTIFEPLQLDVKVTAFPYM